MLYILIYMCVIFFFNQKTAYDMRISDLSSDVCSSDLVALVALVLAIPAFVPLLGWMNWGVLLIAVLGFGLGALSSRNGGRNFNLIVILVCIVRLFLGGGFI